MQMIDESDRGVCNRLIQTLSRYKLVGKIHENDPNGVHLSFMYGEGIFKIKCTEAGLYVYVNLNDQLVSELKAHKAEFLVFNFERCQHFPESIVDMSGDLESVKIGKLIKEFDFNCKTTETLNELVEFLDLLTWTFCKENNSSENQFDPRLMKQL
jgi:hypothetical protein